MKAKSKFYQIVGAVAVVCTTTMAQEPDSTSPAMVAVESNTQAERLDTLENQVQYIMSKAGVHFGGEFESRMLSSQMGGNIMTNPANPVNGYTTENVMNTSLDLNMVARPLEAIGGSVMFRFYTDWRNMFSSFNSPITLRWLSIDGSAKSVFSYSVGDFKAKFSPITVWSPENDLLYEPYVFDRQKQDVMNEEFLGDNNRVMQGINLKLHAKVPSVFDELLVHVYGARTRKAGKLFDTTQTLESITANALTDRYTTAANAYFGFLPATGVGGVFLYNGDAFSTLQGYYPSATMNTASKSIIGGGSAQFGTQALSAVDSSRFTANIRAEFMASKYEKYLYNTTTLEFDEQNFDLLGGEQDGKGNALDVNLDFKIGFNDDNLLKILTGFNRTSLYYINEMAQSPSFYRKNVLNTAFNNINGQSTYNVFDAMYKQVFAYMPAQGEETIGGVRVPSRKIAYTRGVIDNEERIAAYKDSLIEVDLNAALPFGEATPNRVGGSAKLQGEFLKKVLLVEGRFGLYNELEIDTMLYTSSANTTAEFLQFGGGASVDISKLGNWWAYPFVLSGSYMHTGVSNNQGVSGWEQDLAMINAGLYFKVWKRLALIGGYQMLSNDNIAPLSNIKLTQTNWAGGLEYKVAEGGVLTGTVGKVYYDNNYPNVAEFDVLQLDLFLTVQF